MKFKASVNVVEVNRYAFTVEADSKEDAERRIAEHLKTNVPIPSDESINGVRCVDRDAAWETRETESITIKD